MEDSRLLGPVLKAWFAQNEWPQSVSENLARSKGWELGPWASQISICMSGRLPPKPNFFVALGQFNEAVATRDLAGLTDRRLLDRLRKGNPLCKDDGTPWTAQDFFSCYIGQLQMPDELRGPPKQAVTQEMVDQWAEGLRECFREISRTAMLPPREIWNEARTECIRNGISLEEVDWVQDALAGLHEPTLEEAKRMMHKYKDQPLIRALITVQERYGGDTRNLKKFLTWRQQLPDPEPGDGILPMPQGNGQSKGAPAVQREKRIGFDPMARMLTAPGFFIPPA